MTGNRTSTAIALLGTGLAACCVFLLALGDLREQITLCIVVFFGAFVLYGLLLAVLQVFASGTTIPPPAVVRHELTVILAFGLLFRLLLVFSPPALSDDIYRYVWEGRLVARGLNPYVLAPDAPELAPLRDAAVHPHINHRELSTIYPPLSLGLFGLTAQLSPTVAAMNATFLVFDLLTLLVLLQTLRALGLDPRRVAVYAWNPLVVMEFAGSGHVDSAGIFFLMLALYLSLKKQAFGSALSLTCGMLCKFLPILLLPFLNLPRKKTVALGMAAASVVFYSPFLDAGVRLIQSLSIYGRTWAFNASLYELAHLCFGNPDHARLAAGAVFGGFLAVLWWKQAELRAALGAQAPYAAGMAVLGASIALSPVVHPWYVCWLVPFAAVRPSRAALLLSGTVFLSYLVLRRYAAEGVWQEHPSVQCAVYIPVYCVLAAEVMASRRRRGDTSIAFTGKERHEDFGRHTGVQ